MTPSFIRLFRHPSGIAILSSFVIVACGGKYTEGTEADRQVPLDELVGGTFGMGVGGTVAATSGGNSPGPVGGGGSSGGGAPVGVGSAPSQAGGAPTAAGGAINVGAGGLVGAGGGIVASGGQGSGGAPIVVGYASCEQPLDLGRPVFLQIEGRLERGAQDFYQAPCAGQGPEAVFLFHAPQTGIYSFDTRFSDIDAVLSAAAVDCDGVVLACNDDTYDLDSAIGLSMNEGQTVAVIVEDFSGDSGEFSLNVALVQEGETCGVELGRNTGNLWSGNLEIRNTQDQIGECTSSVPAITFRWQAPESGLFDFSTMGSNFDTVMVLRRECGADSIACNDDTQYSPGVTSRIKYEMSEGEEVVIEISTFNGYVDVSSPYLEFSIEQD